MNKSLVFLITLSLVIAQPSICPEDIDLNTADDITIHIKTADPFSCQWKIRNEEKNNLRLIIEREDVTFYGQSIGRQYAADIKFR